MRVSFRCVDKEVFRQPTIPAMVAEGSYTESATRNGAVRYGDCRVTLKGNKTTPQADLISAAIKMCLGKIFSMGSFLTLESFNITVDMWDNVATCQARAMLAAFSIQQLFGANAVVADAKAIVASISTKLATHPGTNPNAPTPPEHPSRGTAKLFLKAAAYFDPAVAGKIKQDNNQLEGGTAIGTGL